MVPLATMTWGAEYGVGQDHRPVRSNPGPDEATSRSSRMAARRRILGAGQRSEGSIDRSGAPSPGGSAGAQTRTGDGPWPNGMPYTVQFPAATAQRPPISSIRRRCRGSVTSSNTSMRPATARRYRVREVVHTLQTSAAHRPHVAEGEASPQAIAVWRRGTSPSAPARAASCGPACRRCSWRRSTSLGQAVSNPAVLHTRWPNAPLGVPWRAQRLLCPVRLHPYSARSPMAEASCVSTTAATRDRGAIRAGGRMVAGGCVPVLRRRGTPADSASPTSSVQQ